MVRELFEMARSKKACIIFFDEVDAIGGARFDDGAGGDNEVQRTMLELINQLDGFDPRGNIKVIMATNRYVLVHDSCHPHHICPTDNLADRTPLILPSSVPVVWTEKSNSPSPTTKVGHTFSKSTANQCLSSVISDTTSLPVSVPTRPVLNSRLWRQKPVCSRSGREERWQQRETFWMLLRRLSGRAASSPVQRCMRSTTKVLASRSCKIG